MDFDEQTIDNIYDSTIPSNKATLHKGELCGWWREGSSLMMRDSALDFSGQVASDSGGYEDFGNGGLENVQELPRTMTVHNSGPTPAKVTHQGQASFFTRGNSGKVYHWQRTQVKQLSTIPLMSRLKSERKTQLGGIHQIKAAHGSEHIGSATWSDDHHLYLVDTCDGGVVLQPHETVSFFTRPRGVPRVDSDVLHHRYVCLPEDLDDGVHFLRGRCAKKACMVCLMAKSRQSPVSKQPADRSVKAFSQANISTGTRWASWQCLPLMVKTTWSPQEIA